MIKKSFTVLLVLSIYSIRAYSQASPVKHFSLKKETTDVAPDSLGTTYLYSTSFEVPDTLTLSAVTFKLRRTDTDSLLIKQNFSLSAVDGIYPTPASLTGLLKDGANYFILLGTLKAPVPLRLVADFTDTRNRHYNQILTNE